MQVAADYTTSISFNYDTFRRHTGLQKSHVYFSYDSSHTFNQNDIHNLCNTFLMNPVVLKNNKGFSLENRVYFGKIITALSWENWILNGVAVYINEYS